jgi:NAD(P)-dependent dehydrogenase (short-subunit alcohol dehydrogenase family)
MTGERTALVTGGARGIGRAIAERLAETGWNVVVTYNTGLDEAKELARTHGVEIRRLDLTDRSGTMDFARRICEEFSFDGLATMPGSSRSNLLSS